MENKGTAPSADPETTSQPSQPGPQPDTLSALERDLAAARETLEKERQQRAIDRALFAASPVDIDATRTLVEKAIESGLDVDRAIAQVRQRSPGLFKHQPTSRGAALAPRTRTPASDLETAQQQAVAGDRKALLRYLRLRRQG